MAPAQLNHCFSKILISFFASSRLMTASTSYREFSHMIEKIFFFLPFQIRKKVSASTTSLK